ncbi:MAG: DegQ family serine endoprotease [Pseudomonadota bacterium]
MLSTVTNRCLTKRLSQCLVVVLFSLAGLANAAELPDFTEIVQQSAAAVVKISTVSKPSASRTPDLQGNQEIPEMFRRFFDQQPRQRRGQGLGSGFFISADGYLLTNNHVVDGADEISVIMQDRREFVAEVIGTDERSDLALLKVEASGLPTVKMGKSEDLDVGEWVLAIGSPFGLDYSVAAGIVSAKGRSLPTEKGENYVPFIQTDVAINPGNSGGPLFNMDGEVVGINSQIYTRSGGSIGLSFAIPVSTALNVIDQLKRDGQVVRGWLGVGIQDINRELAESFGLSKPAGALVSQVVEDGPAEQGGIQVGDVILEFDGQEIGESADLPHIVGRTAPDKRVSVLVFRDGKRKTLRMKTGSLDDGVSNVASRSGGDKKTNGGRLGLVVLDLSDAQKSRLKLEGGVVVRSVVPGSSASEGGLRSGDVITSIDNKSTESLKDYDSIVEGLPANKHVAVRIVRGGQPGFVAIKVSE